MNLLNIRKQFVKLTGRYDLVVDTTDWADNGADFFIQSGQNMIEKLVGDLPESSGRIWRTIHASEYSISFEKRCRMVSQIWTSNSEGRTELIKISWDELKDIYSAPLNEITSGRPAYYCPAKLREIDATDKNASGVFVNFSMASSYAFRGIVVSPPADSDYDIEILGKFLQEALTSDDQENFWTLIYPEVLIQAAIYRNELSYRGRDAVNKLLESILFDLREIDKDIVEETVYGITQIKG